MTGCFVAAHGGPVSFYHSHNDNGDFVFDLNGVRWACALPAEDYNSSLAGSNTRSSVQKGIILYLSTTAVR